MLETITAVNQAVNSFIWGIPAMVCIIGVGLLLSVRTGFLQLRKFPYAIKTTIGRIFRKKDASDGAMTPFQAVCTALAATVGTGNIAGVAGAIAIGGPGAVFWMWCSALLGMCTKFSEVTLAVHFRERNKNGELVGGPMYYIKNGLGSRWQFLAVLYSLFGGLAMFLYGMDRMSCALQRATGDAMKRLLARLTATPLLGVLTGLAVTAVLQSSSAATVMVIGFVSAGLLELPRAVAVIYGINIGTTMTAQLIAFDVQTLVYPVLFLGFLLDFAARRPRWQAVGEAVFSFGLLFEGIDILGRALQPLAGQTVFLGWMTRVKESPLLGILLGLSMTMVVQSSSATIALLQNVARQAGPDGIHSVLGLAGAVPVLLGDNIGTTVTALLACIGQGKNAARAALAHSCFNLSGSLLAAVLLPWFVRLVELISPKGPELEVISRQIANAHTAFNVCCALLWLPFLPWMVRLVCALVPEE